MKPAHAHRTVRNPENLAGFADQPTETPTEKWSVSVPVSVSLCFSPEKPTEIDRCFRKKTEKPTERNSKSNRNTPGFQDRWIDGTLKPFSIPEPLDFAPLHAHRWRVPRSDRRGWRFTTLHPSLSIPTSEYSMRGNEGSAPPTPKVKNVARVVIPGDIPNEDVGVITERVLAGNLIRWTRRFRVVS